MGKIIRNGIKYSGTTNSADKINYNNTLSGLEAETAQEAIDELNSKIGTGGGGSSAVYLTQEEYDALPESKLTDGIEYFITDANTNATAARNIAYDNSESGIEAVSVQGAIDSVNEGLGNISNIGNEIYNSFEKLLKYYIDNGYLPSVNEPNIKLTLYELTLDSYLYVTLNNDGTATLYGVIQSSAVLTNSPIISILPNNCRPKSDVSFTADQNGTGRTVTIKNDGTLTISALHNAKPLVINYTYSLE